MPATPAGKALREWLKRYSLTQSWLAERLGVTRATVSLWVTGKSRVPRWMPYALRGLEELALQAQRAAEMARHEAELAEVEQRGVQLKAELERLRAAQKPRVVSLLVDAVDAEQAAPPKVEQPQLEERKG